MGEVSRKVVQFAVENLNSEIDLLPSTEQFRISHERLREAIELLKECWDTQGGKDEYEKLNAIVNQLDEVEYESELFALKSSSVKAEEINCSSRESIK